MTVPDWLAAVQNINQDVSAHGMDYLMVDPDNVLVNGLTIPDVEAAAERNALMEDARYLLEFYEPPTQ